MKDGRRSPCFTTEHTSWMRSIALHSPRMKLRLRPMPTRLRLQKNISMTATWRFGKDHVSSPRSGRRHGRRCESAVANVVSVAVGRERDFRLFGAAYHVTIDVGFIGSRLHMKITLGGFKSRIERRIGNIAPTENAADQEKGFHRHRAFPIFRPRLFRDLWHPVGSKKSANRHGANAEKVACP